MLAPCSPPRRDQQIAGSLKTESRNQPVREAESLAAHPIGQIDNK
jgi:hypothetical protein